MIKFVGIVFFGVNSLKFNVSELEIYIYIYKIWQGYNWNKRDNGGYFFIENLKHLKYLNDQICSCSVFFILIATLLFNVSEISVLNFKCIEMW